MTRFLLSAATLAALYGILTVYGAEERRPETTRAAGDALAFSFDPGNWFQTDEVIATAKLPEPALSEAEALRVALAAGRAHRDGREARPMQGTLIAAVEAEPDPDAPADQLAIEMWYVTGTTVNVRSGPGTGNPVVAQVSAGDAAEVLDQSGGWMRIRPEGGDVEGWISGRFLDRNQPG